MAITFVGVCAAVLGLSSMMLAVVLLALFDSAWSTAMFPAVKGAAKEAANGSIKLERARRGVFMGFENATPSHGMNLHPPPACGCNLFVKFSDAFSHRRVSLHPPIFRASELMAFFGKQLFSKKPSRAF
jgi:hypothetical protein